MLDQRTRPPTVVVTVRPLPCTRSRLELELREMADDLAGRLDRDEISRAQEALIAEAIEEAVTAALPTVMEVLDRELTPRIEALPLATRLALARARRRRDFGFD